MKQHEDELEEPLTTILYGAEKDQTYCTVFKTEENKPILSCKPCKTLPLQAVQMTRVS